jgi:hypothetical protein
MKVPLEKNASPWLLLDDHPGTGGNYGRICRIPGGRSAGSNPCGGGGVCSSVRDRGYRGFSERLPRIIAAPAIAPTAAAVTPCTKALTCAFDVPTVAIAVATFGLLRFKKVPEPILILGAGVAGLLLFKGQG